MLLAAATNPTPPSRNRTSEEQAEQINKSQLKQNKIPREKSWGRAAANSSVRKTRGAGEPHAEHREREAAEEAQLELDDASSTGSAASTEATPELEAVNQTVSDTPDPELELASEPQPSEPEPEPEPEQNG